MANNKIKPSVGERIFDTVNVIFMIIMIIITLYPMLYVVFASFSNPGKFMMHYGPLWHPLDFTLVSYEAVFKNPNIWNGYRNTLFVVVVGTTINMLLTIIGGYILSRKNWLFKRPLSLGIVFTMYFSGGLIPFYFTVRALKLDNTLWALIIPTAINTYNMIIMRTAFAAVPDSLEESAKLDGASHFTILFKIMVPLVVPTIAVLILYYAVGHWNSWFNAMIFLTRSRSKYPLQLILREILIQGSLTEMTLGAGMDDKEMISETIKYAVIVVSTVPILCLYPFLQKYFIKGIMIGAIKG
ncbi:carbohydrate ABC transporter permease [Caldicoprobacter faecalis]|jgi:putative aldouronate transport system permease protein|uniref:Putative aldouronate transport system permease protein n=1 Tax=Caldicoprobacter faecalis TaxID=937334 RepID=A0A1I5SVF2_9FIRM|nr:carbohydrate ABC transporter permease [Caldicoprobacter faecalis]PZN08077.1 MAG: carbohydrate ABC transporter permease [Caldicoprobacter oshimai]SFP74733.1 putative aldouronate transport system permease protein [Caldicoprobacter faecalis]